MIIDHLDDLTTFCLQFSKWCGDDGFPRSWRHYQYGLAALGRQHMRTEMQMAEATRAAAAQQKDYRDWRREIIMMLTPRRRED